MIDCASHRRQTMRYSSLIHITPRRSPSTVHQLVRNVKCDSSKVPREVDDDTAVCRRSARGAMATT